MSARGGGASGPVVLERQVGSVLVLTLNRPDQRNCVDREVSRHLGDALAKAAGDSLVRAIVLTGAGDGFCSGADLKALARRERVDHPDHPEWGFAGIAQHWSTVPVVAAVNGDAHGGGVEMMLWADIVIASETARFSLPEVRRGIVAAGGGLLRLQRQVPQKVALQMLLTGEAFTAVEAERWGLVSELTSPANVLTRALEVAEVIAANAPLAVQGSKELVYKTRDGSGGWSEDIWGQSDALIHRLLRTNDAKEGPRAFVEKRRPSWTGS